MFGLSLSYPLPEPLVHYDVSANPTAISDLDSSTPAVLPDLSGNGLDLSAENWNMSAPAWKFNPWVVVSNRVEATELKTGVWHVTKLTPPSTSDNERIVFQCDMNSFVGLGTKFNIFVSCPAGKTFQGAEFYISTADGSSTDIMISLQEGVTLIDLSQLSSVQGTNAYVRIPASFYSQDTSGGLLETETDFYLVFFPVLDESKAYGFGEYLVPKFDADGGPWFLQGYFSVEGNVATCTSYRTDSFNIGGIDLEVYYYDKHIIVANPFVINLKVSNSVNYELGLNYYGMGANYDDDTPLPGHGTKYLPNGEPFKFYGSAVVGEFMLDAVVASFTPTGYFYEGDTIQLLPYNYDHLTFLPFSFGGKNLSFTIYSNTEHKTLSTHIAKFSFSTDCVSSAIKSDSTGRISGIFFDSREGREVPALSSYDLMVSKELLLSTVNGQRVVNCTDNDLVDTVLVGSTVWKPSNVLDSFSANIFRVKASNNISYAKGTFYSAVCFTEALTPWQINAAMHQYEILP